MREAEDFRAESRALHSLLSGIDVARFNEATLFKNWSTNDVLRHLFVWNDMARLQIEDEAELDRRLNNIMTSGGDLAGFERGICGAVTGAELLTAWHDGFELLADMFAHADPKQRLKWAGPTMSARSSITARQMETWAHGQEIYDHFGVERNDDDRIRNIVVLGLNTFRWTYLARGVEPPGPAPTLKLFAPNGDVWCFGEESESGFIEGLASEFCQVVTQTRNVADTQLQVTGAVANDWMSKAQCFAGPATEPPAPGARYREKHGV